MKKCFSWVLLLSSIVLLNSCQKEYSLENGGEPSSGTLQDDVSGECLPKNVLGIYEEGVALVANDNYIEVQVDVTTPGSYSITTDLVNGMKFSANGFFNNTGLVTVKLRGSGTPIAAGIHNFIVSYDGSQCTVAVTTLPEGGGDPAEFTLNATAGACVSYTLAGAYAVGVPLGSSHTVTLNVTVTTPGTYNITTTAVNGITFAGTGSLPIAGAATIQLTASGTPTTAGTTNIPVTAGTSNCGFEVPVAAAAAFTVDCGTAVVNGTYTEGTALGVANTVEVDVNVTTAGVVVLTGTGNGMTFSGSATLTVGTHTLTLTGTGTPAADGDFDIDLNGTTGTCSFTVTVEPGAPASDLKWKFNVGTTVYEGPTDIALVVPNPPLEAMNVFGETTAGDIAFNLAVLKTGAVGTGSYSSGTLPPGNSVTFMFANVATGTLVFSALPGNSNLQVNITVFNTTTGIVEGTFSGTAKDASNNNVTISNGTFKVELP